MDFLFHMTLRFVLIYDFFRGKNVKKKIQADNNYFVFIKVV